MTMYENDDPTINIVPAARGPMTPDDSITRLMEIALGKGESAVAALEKLVILHERVQARAAESAFNAALAAFQAECPSVPCTSQSDYATAGGSRVRYTYAELDQIAATIRPLLHKHGLSYNWNCSVNGKDLVCTCTLRHSSGHSTAASFQCPTENKGGMGEQQKVASALTYARRYSLVQVLGLSTGDPSPDTAVGDVSKLDERQLKNLESLLTLTNSDVAKFCKFMNVANLADIEKRNYPTALMALERKSREKERLNDHS